MKKNVIQVCCIFWLVLFALPAAAEDLKRASSQELGFSPERLERLSETLESYINSGQVAGSVTLVLRHGKIAYFEAFGQQDLAAQLPMLEDTMFRIASQTKAIVSVAAMILQEEGKLLIQDPVGRHLPEFMETTVAVSNADGSYEVVPANRPITIRDLLTHISGFDYGYGIAADEWAAAGIQGYYFSDRDEPIRETIARMASLPANAQPGEKWEYGYSTDILGAVVEQAAGMPLDVFLQERVFSPLGMGDTYFYLPPAKANRLATVYKNVDGTLERAVEDGPHGQGKFIDGPRKSFSGGAGLISTANDYARFLQMILNQGELDGVRILGRKSVELMSVDHLGDIAFRPGMGFGLGFSVLEEVGARGWHGSVGELAWGGAYHSSYWIDPVEDLVVVYLTQLFIDDGLDDPERVRATVYQAIVD